MMIRKPLPSLSQAEMLEKMNDARKKRNEGQVVYLVDHFPPVQELKSMTYLGSFAWTSKATNERWIRKRFAYDLGAGWVTPSDIARDYISVKFEGVRLKCNTRQWQEVVKKRKHQPLYAKPCTLQSATYLDMQSAYWQLLMLGGWDIDYMPKRYLSPRSDVYDFPVPEIKLARNCLVSMGLPSGANVWIPNYGFAKRSPQKTSVNLILWGFIQDVFHGVGYDMVTKAQAAYVNTDGYIIPDDQYYKAEELASNWGLVLTIRHQGKAVIRGAGDYDIGPSVGRRVRTVPRFFSYLQPREIDWLRQKVKFWSNRIRLDMKNVSVQKDDESDGTNNE